MDGLWRRQTTLSSYGFAAALFLLSLPLISSNPHAPKRLTWRVMSPHTGQTAWSVTNIAPKGTWWPDLTPDLCAMAAGYRLWDLPERTVEETKAGIETRAYIGKGRDLQFGVHCSYLGARERLTMTQFYVCPKDRQGHRKNCGSEREYFCAEWGCETTGTGYWIRGPPEWDLIQVRRNESQTSGHRGWVNALNISFTSAGRSYDLNKWRWGVTWGIRLYKDQHDDGLLFKIRLDVQDYRPPVAVGPNTVLSSRQLPTKERPLATTTVAGTSPASREEQANPIELETNSGQRLLGLVEGAFSSLNMSKSNLTESCWLCLTTGPPYYEGIAFQGNYTNTTSHDHCSWGQQGKLTLTEVSGQGTCIGQVPKDRQHLCKENLAYPSSASYYLVPPTGGWWACSTGLTPCLAAQAFNRSQDYCILVQLVPRIMYYQANAFEKEFDSYSPSHRDKRELVSLTLAALLGLGVAAGVGTGTTALIKGPTYTEELRAAIDEDLKHIEHSITKLEESLTSLSEVVLQNRRGLDLLFLKEGGLCAALREQCCFYADHSGVIKDSMSKLRERLETRKREREAKQGWFESWFNSSPWFTTLISSLVGPLIILLLLLTFGPCIVNRLIAFIQDRISAVQVMVLQQRYQPVPSNISL
uniref:Envelope glycoprotein n=1 Tax=Myotis myotis TaxID=51298 RepID=A0A7J7UQ89_MYOMY|nr:hypothetical protein mMyoMyo1_008696 [Myotis myotis]KAF6319741.1 hypothetical protein mMyoMyo1_008480 [Myotis myotis]KAF6319788.1 hypothetical protein mMyoMyo1_008525 [Myotis myotis]KAF6324902.1 hypothetical protein mMyoMyo1_008353 [Myotis myotis]KAF6349116.1 hypothetical protein mMyoMyo1_011672 [Myotis myotis]